MKNKIKNLVDANEISSLLKRISHEIVESSDDIQNIALIGIQSRGDYIANRIANHINSISKCDISLGTIDVTFHRDDYKTNLGSPEIGVSNIKFDVTDRDLILVDDVLYTGRTTRAALDSILDYGRPKRIELVVLVDRGHRELPIRAGYVGEMIETTGEEVVDVQMTPIDHVNGVFLTTKELLRKG